MPGIYADPRIVMDLSECYFYHTMDVPTFGTIEGIWDLRADLKEYLGNVAFSGKKVLDIGAANGMISFSVESLGADVISFDVEHGTDYEVIPYAKWTDYEKCQKTDLEKFAEGLKNAYWLVHRLKNSHAKAVYGTVYKIPKEIGFVDISVLGSILLHLKDPFAALQSALRMTKETAIVTDVYRPELNCSSRFPSLVFLPDAKEFKLFDAWWYLTPEIVVKYLEVLGFEDTQVMYHQALYNGQKGDLYTVVGHRTCEFMGW